jgi:hypothetical protein
VDYVALKRNKTTFTYKLLKVLSVNNGPNKVLESTPGEEEGCAGAGRKREEDGGAEAGVGGGEGQVPIKCSAVSAPTVSAQFFSADFGELFNRNVQAKMCLIILDKSLNYT